MKKNILALMCAASMVLFSACDKSNGNGGEGGSGSALQGKWITSQQQLADFPGDSKNNECWEYKVFCDGTVIGTEYIWNTEALIQYMIKQSMDGEIKAYGEVRKKYMYTKVEEPTEAACESRVWEGAVCLLETISWTDSLGHQQSQSEYCWIPEKNMQERHDYYMSVMKPAEEARGKSISSMSGHVRSSRIEMLAGQTIRMTPQLFLRLLRTLPTIRVSIVSTRNVGSLRNNR